MLTRLSDRERRIVIGAAIVLGVALPLRFVVVPLFNSWQDARADRTAKLDAVRAANTTLDSRDLLIRRLSQRIGPSVGGPIPGVADAQLQFPDTVRSALSNAGVDIRSLDLQGARRNRDTPGISMVALTVQGRADGQGLPGFLRELSTTDLPVLVDSFSLEQAEGRDKWQIRLTLSTPATEPEARR